MDSQDRDWSKVSITPGHARMDLRLVRIALRHAYFLETNQLTEPRGTVAGEIKSACDRVNNLLAAMNDTDPPVILNEVPDQVEDPCGGNYLDNRDRISRLESDFNYLEARVSRLEGETS